MEAFVLVPVLMLLVPGIFLLATRPIDRAPFIVGLGIVGSASTSLRTWGYRLSAWGWVESDRMGQFLSLLILAGVGLSLVAFRRSVEPEESAPPRSSVTDGLTLIAASGMLLMVSTRNLLVVFVALETVSYALAALGGQRALVRYSNRLASVCLVLGLVIVGVGLGRFDVAEIETVLATRPWGGAGLASSLFVIGAFLKLLPPLVGSRPVAVPATLVAQTALLGALLRMRGWLFDLGPMLDVVIGVLAVGWMLVGSLAALGRGSWKSVLASTFLVHTGLAALGVVAGGDEGREAVLFYLLTFSMSGLGAWAAAGLDGSGGDEKKGPPSRMAFGLFVGSLAGAPLTIGFVGRLLILRVAVDQNETVGVAAALASLTVCFYVYVRMVLDALGEQSETELSSVKAGWGRAVVLVVCAAVILSAGVWPEPGLALVKQVAMEFF